ncbi:MAG: GAF domain-containing protein, partial [Phycisphaerae bacterium]|nr:GAF domain-containing protein [Phycisphaerae bacterium]
DVVFRLRLVADDEKIVHVRFKPIYDEEGSCTRIAGTIQDVTEQKEQEKSLKEYSQRLQTLHTIDRAILSASTLEAIAQVGVEQLRAIVPSYRAAVRMLNEDRTALEAIATDADEETWITAGHLTPVSDVLEVDIFKKVLAGEDMIIVGFDKPGPHPPLLQALIDEGIQSGFSIPLMAKENVIGTISLTSKDANAFSKHHMEIAKEISNSLSVAIQQAML